MRLPAVFVGKRVKNAERRPPQPQREPEWCAWLLFRHGKPSFQQLGDVVFLARFGFQSCEQSDFVLDHVQAPPGFCRATSANEADDDRAMTIQTDRSVYTTVRKRDRLRALLFTH